MDHARRFESLFLAHEPDLRAFVACVVLDPASRDDVLQEVALALWKAFPAYDSARSFGAWARGVARHKVFDHLRRTSRRTLVLSAEAVVSVSRAFAETGSDQGQRETALADCLRTLPARSSELVAMRYAERSTIDQLADRFGTSAAAIYQQLSRLRAALGECIRRRLAEPECARAAPPSGTHTA